jgi:uncharacterized membrane protein YfcA
VPVLDAWELAGVFGAGLVAGTVNTVVGSGSLLTFPTLLAFGFRPLVANVSNTIGLVPGSVSGALGYRRELRGQRARVIEYSGLTVAGGALGGALLLLLPSSSFEKVVPFLIVLACVLVAVQPWLSARVAERAEQRADAAEPRPRRRMPVLDAGVFLTAVYGGYFGAAQGVIMIALLAIFVDDAMQRLNALKNVLAAVVNGTSALIFAFFAPVSWTVVVVLGIGAAIGGQLGAHVGRRLPPEVLRIVIVVVGLVVAVKLFLSW